MHWKRDLDAKYNWKKHRCGLSALLLMGAGHLMRDFNVSLHGPASRMAWRQAIALSSLAPLVIAHLPLKLLASFFFSCLPHSQKLTKITKTEKKNKKEDDHFVVFQPAVILPRMYL